MAEQPTKLGVLPDENAPARDAIHIAIAQVFAAHVLRPGDHVGLDDRGRASAAASPTVGIVDPFLATIVTPGQAFYLCLYPQTITSLRHDWTHPAFEATTATRPQPTTKPHVVHVADSKAWLERKAAQLDLTLPEMLAHAQTWLDRALHIVQRDAENWRDDFGDPVEFWHHYEIYTGTQVPQDMKESFYCCAC